MAERQQVLRGDLAGVFGGGLSFLQSGMRDPPRIERRAQIGPGIQRGQQDRPARLHCAERGGKLRGGGGGRQVGGERLELQAIAVRAAQRGSVQQQPVERQGRGRAGLRRREHRHQQPVAPSGHAARGKARDIAERSDRLLHPRPRLGADAGAVIDHPRHGLPRHCGGPCHVLDGDASPHPCLPHPCLPSSRDMRPCGDPVGAGWRIDGSVSVHASIFQSVS